MLWGNVVGKCLTVITLGLMLTKGYGLHEKYKGREEGKAQIVQESKVEGKKINEKSKKNSDAVDANFDKLLKQYCRDCK